MSNLKLILREVDLRPIEIFISNILRDRIKMIVNIVKLSVLVSKEADV